VFGSRHALTQVSACLDGRVQDCPLTKYGSTSDRDHLGRDQLAVRWARVWARRQEAVPVSMKEE